jgi:predicted CXXCH cytochrome family protein
MDIREIGKTRSQRIEIDYYRKPTWLTRSRWILALVALVIATAYALIVLASNGGRHVSTGPLALAHASFENDCSACHHDFTPLAADAKWFATSVSLEKNEQACRQCHQDLVDHFRSHLSDSFTSIDQQCSGCHREHQGRDHNLVRLQQQACTQCHADLASVTASPSSVAIRANVTAFTQQGHGDFQSLKKGDPGRIQFSHTQHMLPGQVPATNKGGLTLAMVEPSLREAYRKSINGIVQNDAAAVTLSCTDCHTLSGVPDPRVSSDDEVGRHMEPISFDRHCAGCHAMNAPGRTDQTLPLPHAAPWTEIDTIIWAKIAGGRQTGAIRVPRQPARTTPLVGEGQDGLVSPDPAEDIEAVVASARASVRAQCLKCHEEQDVTDEAVVRMQRADRQPLLPTRWLRRGIYDHAAHRRIDCVYCHQAAYPSDADVAPAGDQPAMRPNDSEVVMIGGIETCVDCHRSSTEPLPEALTRTETKTILGGQSTWASDSCTQCHRYHWRRAAWTDADSTAELWDLSDPHQQSESDEISP